MASRHPRPALPPGPYLVLGLGRSGVAAAQALRACGERVIGWDAGAPPEAGRLSELGVEVHLDASGDAFAAVSEARALIKSPGVPPDVPTVARARACGIPVVGELELGWRMLPNEFIAVTGTNGKTTTTEWIAHIHREAALSVVAAGNVGTAVCSLVGQLHESTTVVCEASSFQLEDSERFAPEAAVLLNLAPDHLDRHPSYDDYVSAKLRIFTNQGNDDVAVVPLRMRQDDLGGCARRVLFGREAGAELAERAGQLWWGDDPLLAADEVSLPGDHNLENAMAAAAVALARGIEPSAVAEGLRSFKGVSHRLELIAERGEIRFVNDSKATNVSSTLMALSAYPGGIHLIAGGRGKRQDFAPLASLVAERCTAVYVIGEAMNELADALRGTGVDLFLVGDLERAVRDAVAGAKRGEVVLLSPACASYDQYRDFEKRGEHFRSLVQREFMKDDA